MTDDAIMPTTRTLHEAALDELPCPILVHDHHRVLYANRAALQALGADDDTQVVGRELSTFVHADGAAAGAARRRIVMEQGHAVTDIPVKLVGVDGATRYATVAGRPIVFGDAQRAILVTARTLP